MSVTAAGGFSAGGIHSGVKPSGVLDLATVFASTAVPTAAVFTTSRTAAPPVRLSQSRVATGLARAVIVNSGSANAGTGAGGLADAEAMSAALATSLDCAEEHVLVCSTGPIGGRLPIDAIVAATPVLVAEAGSSTAQATRAAEAIMTTDSVPKESSVRRFGVTVGGMSKGAGMIRPDMATMLAFLTTDAIADAAVLNDVLARAVDETFNALNIDGCQSTNDSVTLMASGLSGESITSEDLLQMVTEVCADLTLQMAADAEGASKVVTLDVTGARSNRDARAIGLQVADSALVRTSFFGADPNWGRVLGAVGVAGVDIEPDRIEISYDGTLVTRGGTAVGVDEDELSSRLTGDFSVAICVGRGDGHARIVTTDLTPEYVVFNGERS